MRFCTWNVKVSYRAGSLRRVAGEIVKYKLRLVEGYYKLKQHKTRLSEGRSKLLDRKSQTRMVTGALCYKHEGRGFDSR
jgi:hypothetical protein